MTRIVLYFALSCVSLLGLATPNCYAQNPKYDLSAPLDIPTAGWNKVLALKNGGAMLVHLEPSKPMMIKVFEKIILT